MLRYLLGVALLAASMLAAAQDATLDRARQLIQTKQARAAFELLSPLEQQRAGEVEFDYLLGVAAVDTGQLTRGIFALERVLAVRPEHPQARAEIARAYYLAGENKLARQEFESVKRGGAPAEVASTIDRFLNALDARDRSRHTGVTGYLEATVGYDNNANSATSQSEFAIPLFPGLRFNLAPNAARQDDEFWSLAGGISGRYGLDDNLGLIGNASFDQRYNSTFGQFDIGSLNASGGVSYRRGGDEYIVALQTQSYSVDYTRFRDANGIVAQWRRSFSQNDQLTAYLQQTRLEYPTQTARNSDRTVVGAGWAHAYVGPFNPVVFAGVYGGQEEAMSEAFPHLGHDLWGLRLGGQAGLTERWSVSASGSFEHRRYGGTDPLFLVRRDDKELQLRLAANYAIDRNWSVTPAVTYTDNQSNIVVNAYDRTVASVSLRYDFR